MTRPRLRRPDQSLPVRLLLGLYERAASLQLAVVLIATMAFVLATATLLESHYGDKSRAINEGIYETWWFALLNGLLGLNVLCAALIRFPWTRRQTGFVVTHAGILLLLLGSAISHSYGVDANLPVYEGESEWRAYENTQHFRLSVFGDADPGAATGTVHSGSHPQIIELPFSAGPFNWDDYAQRPWFPWGLTRWDRGVRYDRDGIKLEVIDYLSDSIEQIVPQVTVVAAGRGVTQGAEAPAAERVTLEIQPASTQSGLRPYGSSAVKTLAGGQNLCFWMSGDAGETEAFRKLLPEGPLGVLGQLALFHAGKTYRFAVDKLEPGVRHPLGDSGLEIELQKLETGMLAALLQVYRGNEAVGRMALLANRPQYNAHDYTDHLFGEYYFDPPQDPKAAKAKGLELSDEHLAQWAAPRVDLFQGADLKLYCRAWRPPQMGAAVSLSAGGPLLLWEKTPVELALQLDDFHPSEKLGKQVLPVEYQASKSTGEKQRRARVALTVDGNTQEFWLAGLMLDPESQPLPGSQRRVVAGKGRHVALTLSLNVIDVGFCVHLQKFVRKLDPGSGAPSYFASVVDFVDRHHPQQKLRSDVLITLNEPVNFSDPYTGRSFRLYQASFSGPFGPGDEQFEQVVGGKDLREQLYMSNFSVNYDPGRPWKYSGCLLIVAGILIIFYMKAYFFARVVK
jgi:hypothetical protein